MKQNENTNDNEDWGTSVPEMILSYLQWSERRGQKVSLNHLVKHIEKSSEYTLNGIRKVIRDMLEKQRIFKTDDNGVKYITLNQPLTGLSFLNRKKDRIKEALKAENRIPYFPHKDWNAICQGGLCRGTHTGFMVRFSWGKSNQVSESIATMLHTHGEKFRVLLLSTEEDEDMYCYKMREMLQQKYHLSTENAEQEIDSWGKTGTLRILRTKAYETLTAERLLQLIKECGGFDLIVIDYIDGDEPIAFPNEKIGKSPIVRQCDWLRDFASSSLNGVKRIPAIVSYLQPKVKDGTPSQEAQGDATGSIYKHFHFYVRMIIGCETSAFSGVYQSRYEVVNVKQEYYCNVRPGQNWDITYNNNTFTTETFKSVEEIVFPVCKINSNPPKVYKDSNDVMSDLEVM